MRTVSNKSGQLVAQVIANHYLKKMQKVGRFLCGSRDIIHLPLSSRFFYSYHHSDRLSLNVIHLIITFSCLLKGCFQAAGVVAGLHLFLFYICLLWLLICNPMATRGIKNWKNIFGWFPFTWQCAVCGWVCRGRERHTLGNMQLTGRYWTQLCLWLSNKPAGAQFVLSLIDWLINWNKHKTKGLFWMR